MSASHIPEDIRSFTDAHLNSQMVRWYLREMALEREVDSAFWPIKFPEDQRLGLFTKPPDLRLSAWRFPVGHLLFLDGTPADFLLLENGAFMIWSLTAPFTPAIVTNIAQWQLYPHVEACLEKTAELMRRRPDLFRHVFVELRGDRVSVHDR
jgi:hypothetical protein